MDPQLMKYHSQVLSLIKLFGPLDDNYDRSVEQMNVEVHSNVRDEISAFLNDPQFMRALFLLNQLLPPYRSSVRSSVITFSGEDLAYLLFEDREKITDPQLLEVIVRYAPSILKYADPQLLKDPKFMLKLCQIVENVESIVAYANYADPIN
jgi:hypothetical protein